jgi:transcriptional regulator with XRE-family HTH domain
MKIGKSLKSLRKEKKITLKELSDKTGVQIATLSRMENDIMTGTLESHMKICQVLGVPLSKFYKELEEDEKTLSLNKKSEKRESFIYSKKATTEILTDKVMNKKIMPLLIKIQKNGKTHKEEERFGTEKFAYIIEGKVEITVGKESYKLIKGESIYFDAAFPHVFQNIGISEARVLCAMTPPAF